MSNTVCIMCVEEVKVIPIAPTLCAVEVIMEDGALRGHLATLLQSFPEMWHRIMDEAGAAHDS